MMSDVMMSDVSDDVSSRVTRDLSVVLGLALALAFITGTRKLSKVPVQCETRVKSSAK